jgi:amidophosphoribosyltransferase
MIKLKGNMGIAHVRYPTAGSSSSAEAQPFYVNSPYGITLAHNGNLTNSEELKDDIFREDLRHINTTSDTEILLNVLAHELQIQGKLRIDENDIFKAVAGVHRRCRGGYAAIAMIPTYGILAFRDPNGIRPVVFGKKNTDQGVEYMIASESVVLDSQDFELVRDIRPGEAIYITHSGEFYSYQCASNPVHCPCIFEYVYFARPDSIIDNIFVHKARSRMGQKLAEKIKREWPDHDIDVVIPIPDTSRTSALALANGLGIHYTEGFIKNRYIGRTFIMPGQQVRKKSVRQKLNAIDLEFKNKNVMLIDDSIVRGTTSKQIVQMAREAGARKVYFASAAPPVRFPNVYGIDMPSANELVAHNRTIEEIRQTICCDKLIYQDLSDLIDAVNREGKVSIKQFDTSVFDGKYITGDVNAEYLEQLELIRSDAAKESREEASRSILDIHNNP